MNTAAHGQEALHLLGDLNIRLNPSDDIRGKVLHDSAGNPIGRVHELIVSHDRQRIVYLDVEDRTLLGKRRFLIPVSEVTIHSGDGLHLKSSGECSDETPWNCPELMSRTPAAASFME